MNTLHEDFNENQDFFQVFTNFMEASDQQALEILKDLAFDAIHYVDVFL